MPSTVRRIVTSHNDYGESVLHSDEQVTLSAIEGVDGLTGIVAWSTNRVPADNVFDDDGADRDHGATIKEGSVLRVTELGPGFTSPMHRSHSIDYVVVLSGALELELDAETRVRAGAGDVIVQRGTNHIWHNPDAETPCRILVAMIEADPVHHDGEPLPQTL